MLKLYDYRGDCGVLFEFRSANPDAPLKCTCGSPSCVARRVPSGTLGFHLKGTGYYATDFKKPN